MQAIAATMASVSRRVERSFFIFQNINMPRPEEGRDKQKSRRLSRVSVGEGSFQVRVYLPQVYWGARKTCTT